MAELHPERYTKPVDYILLWDKKGGFPAWDWIQKNYVLIFSEGRLEIYERKADIPLVKDGV